MATPDVRTGATRIAALDARPRLGDAASRALSDLDAAACRRITTANRDFCRRILLIAGRVPVMFDIWHSAKRYVDTGQIKIIAGASAERLSDTPSTPAIAESYPGFAVMAMNALYGPSGVPAPVLTKVSTDVRAIVESSEFKEKTKHLGIHTWGTTPQELDAWTRKEIANWAEVAKAANIKVD